MGIYLPSVISCSCGSTDHLASLLWCSNSLLLTRKMNGLKWCLTAQLLLLKSKHSRHREMKEHIPNRHSMFTNHFCRSSARMLHCAKSHLDFGHTVNFRDENKIRRYWNGTCLLKRITTLNWGDLLLPYKNLFISQRGKKNQSQFSATAAQLGSRKLVFLQLLSFRENNHLEASLHLVAKEIIKTKRSRCSLLVFPE